jgi:dihydroflavonol-4-reductase
MNILVTGATGFIGFNLVKFLLNKGYRVFALIRDPQKAAQLSTLNVTLINKDIRELDSLTHKTIKVDTIFHLAGVRGEGRGSQKLYQEINIEGTKKLLSVFGGRIQRFIYCSSVSVYGHHSYLPADEEHQCSPNKIYGWSKLQAEKLAQSICLKQKIPMTIIRPVISYGPYDFYGMITKLFKLIDKQQFYLIGNGKNRVHLVYISDLIEGFHLALKKPQAEGEIFIIAGQRPIMIKDLLLLIAKELSRKVPKFKIPISLAKICGLFIEKLYALAPGIFPGEPIVTRDKIDILTVDRCYSIDKATKLLGYSPKVDYNEGIKITAQWLRKNKIIGNNNRS